MRTAPLAALALLGPACVVACVATAVAADEGQRDREALEHALARVPADARLVVAVRADAIGRELESVWSSSGMAASVEGELERAAPRAQRGGLGFELDSLSGLARAGMDLRRPVILATVDVGGRQPFVVFPASDGERLHASMLRLAVARHHAVRTVQIAGHSVDQMGDEKNDGHACAVDGDSLVCSGLTDGGGYRALFERLFATPPGGFTATEGYRRTIAQLVGGGERWQVLALGGPGLGELLLPAMLPRLPLLDGLARDGGGLVAELAGGRLRLRVTTLDDAGLPLRRVMGSLGADAVTARFADVTVARLRLAALTSREALATLERISEVSTALADVQASLGNKGVKLDLREELTSLFPGHLAEITLLALPPADPAAAARDFPLDLVAVVPVDMARALRSVGAVLDAVVPRQLVVRVPARAGRSAQLWCTLGDVGLGVADGSFIVVKGAGRLTALRRTLGSASQPAVRAAPPVGTALSLDVALDALAHANLPSLTGLGRVQGALRSTAGGLSLDLSVEAPGALAARFAAAVARYRRRSRSVEAHLRLRNLITASLVYWEEEHADARGNPLPRSLPPSSDWTPSGDPCRSPTQMLAPAPAQWQQRPWSDLHFSIDEPTRFQYRYTSVGKGSDWRLTVEARADLGCLHEPVTLRRTGHTDEAATLVIDPEEPDPYE